MNQEDQPKRIRTSRFFRSSASRFGFGPGKIRYGNIRSLSGIVPKRSIPKEIDQTITPQSPSEEVAPKAVSYSLGRLTLDLVQIGDNLDTIKGIIEEDYKQTKETNKKEIEEYRKRVANRGRKLPKKDLGDNKKELKDIIKPFVGSFFSGIGGAIRSLAAFNLLDALVRGDYGQVFKSLMGIGITFLPQIGAMVAGAVLKSLVKGFGKNMFGARAPRVPGGMARGPGIGLGKFGKMAALGTGALALGSAFAASQSDETSTQTDNQTRLEQLTAEQKGLTSNGLGVITQDDLKKFQALNQKFEQSINLLLTKGGQGQRGPGGQGGTDASGAAISDQPVNMDTSLRGTVEGQQFNNAQLIDLAKKVGATDEEAVRLAAIAKYESGGRSGAHNDSYLRGGSDNSYGLWQINMIGSLGPARMKEFGISSYDQLKDPVTNAQAALKVLRGSGWSAWTTNSKVTSGDLQEGRRNLNSRQPTPPPAPAPAAKPQPRSKADLVGSGAGSGPRVAVVPVPQMAGADGLGSANPAGSSALASISASNRSDMYSYETQMGILGAIG